MKWCWQQGFGFQDHKTLFEDQGLLGRDGIHLTMVCRSVFTNKLASLVRTVLNKEQQSRENITKHQVTK